MTSDEAAFLLAIRQNPADDLNRLVYADWLDEHGDPRSKWLRADVGSREAEILSERYWELKGVREELRATLDPSWLAQVAFTPVHRPLFTKLPDSRPARWRLADTFIETWHDPLKPGDGYTEAELQQAEHRLGIRLPAALREWYALAGKRRDIWSVQDHLDAPNNLRFAPRGLVVRYENQGCDAWLIRAEDLNKDDPLVYHRDDGRLSCSSVSAFALFVLLYESQFGTRIWCELYPDEAAWRKLSHGMRRVGIDADYWVLGKLTLWEGEDVLVVDLRHINSDPDMYVAARTEAAFERVRSIVGAERMVRND